MRWRALLIAVLIAGALGASDVLLRARAASPSVSIGFIGDSITAGYGLASPPGYATVALLGTPARAVVLGALGTTTLDWQPDGPKRYFPKAVAILRADGVRLVQVALGTNDASRATRVAPTAYRARLGRIARALVRDGFTVVLEPPPYAVPGAHRGLYDAGADARLAAYAGEIRALANGTTVRAGDLSIYAAFRRHPDWLSDGIHPNARGATMLARTWSRPLQAAMGGE